MMKRTARGWAYLGLAVLAQQVPLKPTLAQEPARAGQSWGKATFSAELGELFIPGATCNASTPCAPQRRSMEVAARGERRHGPWGLGAGLVYALPLQMPSTLAERDATLQREHQRELLIVEGQLRWFPWEHGPLELWVGSMAGWASVKDSWTVLASREPPEGTAFIRPRALSLGREGLSAGAAIGIDRSLWTHWSLGSTGR